MSSSTYAQALSRVLDNERARLSTWWPLVADLNGTEAVSRYLARGRRGYLDGSALPYLILDGDEPIGEVCLAIDEQNRSADLSYWLAEPHQGRGIGRQAAHTLIDRALSELGLIRIQAGTVAGNERSENLLRSLRFRREGRLRSAVQLAGRPADLVVYGLLAEEHRARPCTDHACYGAAAKA